MSIRLLLLPLLFIHLLITARALPNPRQLALIADPLWLEASVLPLLAAANRPQQLPELTNIGLAHCLSGGEFTIQPLQLQLGQRLNFMHCQRDDWHYHGVAELARDDSLSPANRFNLALLPLLIREGQGPKLRLIWNEQGEFTPGSGPWRWHGAGSALIGSEQPQAEILEFHQFQRQLSHDGDNQLRQRLSGDMVLDSDYQLQLDSHCQLLVETMPRCRLLRLRLTDSEQHCWQWPDTSADCHPLAQEK